MKTTPLSTAAAQPAASRLSREIYRVAEKFHLNFLKIVLPLFVLVAGMDYLNYRDIWLELLAARFVIVALSIGGYFLYRKGHLDANWLMVFVASTIGMHSATVVHFSTLEYLGSMNFALTGFYLAIGLFTLAKLHQTALICLIVLVWDIVMVVTAEAYTFEDWIDANGFFVVMAALVTIFLSRLRRNLHLNEIRMRLELEESKEVLAEQNKSLEEAKSKLEYYAKHLEAEGENRTESLRKASEERDQMVYRLSHDFKSPMVNVRSLSSMAQQVNDPVQLKFIFDKIDQSLGQFETLVNDMNNFVTYSRDEVFPINFNLPELVQTTWAVAGKAHPHDMEINAPLPPELTIHSDPQKVTLVLDSIMRNAILFKRSGEGGKLTVEGDLKGKDLVLTLSDNGPGIPEDVRGKVFDLFYRGDERSSGLGMGLYLVRATMEQLGGSVQLTSTSKGTTLELSFPGVLAN